MDMQLARETGLHSGRVRGGAWECGGGGGGAARGGLKTERRGAAERSGRGGGVGGGGGVGAGGGGVAASEELKTALSAAAKATHTNPVRPAPRVPSTQQGIARWFHQEPFKVSA